MHAIGIVSFLCESWILSLYLLHSPGADLELCRGKGRIFKAFAKFLSTLNFVWMASLDCKNKVINNFADVDLFDIPFCKKWQLLQDCWKPLFFRLDSIFRVKIFSRVIEVGSELTKGFPCQSNQSERSLHDRVPIVVVVHCVQGHHLKISSQFKIYFWLSFGHSCYKVVFEQFCRYNIIQLKLKGSKRPKEQMSERFYYITLIKIEGVQTSERPNVRTFLLQNSN